MKGNLNDHVKAASKKRLAYVRERYVDKGWSQQKIADELGITRQRVQRILADAGITKGERNG